MQIFHIIVAMTMSSAIGTFLANFTLLWIIGTQAKEEQKRQLLLLEEYEKKLVERDKAYMAMES